MQEIDTHNTDTDPRLGWLLFASLVTAALAFAGLQRMKTGFLFGLVSLVIIATVVGVIEAFKGDPNGFIAH